MTKRKKIGLAAIGAAMVAVAGYAAFGRPSDATSMTTDTAKRMDLARTVEVTGDVRSVDEIDLSFDLSGRVEYVGASVGDAVTAGTLIAALDSDERDAAYRQALGRLEEAQANLTLKEAGISDEETAVGAADVDVAKAAYAAAVSDASQAVASGLADVESAEADLEATESDTEAGLTQAREDLAESLRSLVAQVRFALADADTVLGVENTLYTQEFDDVLSNTDAQARVSAENAFEAAATSRNRAEDALIAMDATSQDSVDAAADLAQTAYDEAYETLLQTSRVLDGTSSNSADLSLDDLNAFKATVSAAMGSLIADGTALVNARQAYANAERAAEDDLRAAQNALASARAARDRDLARADAAVTSRAADLARAEAAYAESVAAPREVDLASARAAVSQAEADAASAFARAEAAQLRAPIDGILTRLDVDAGESVSGGVSVVTVLSSGQNYEVLLDIPESDVAKTTVGQRATVTFDAFGDDVSYVGTLATIDPAQRVIEGVVFYQASVLLTPDQDLTAVKPGMSADVVLLTGERTGVLAVPTRAVLERDGERYVRVPAADGTYEERPVRVGLRADGGLTEILDGIVEGETVIVSIR